MINMSSNVLQTVRMVGNGAQLMRMPDQVNIQRRYQHFFLFLHQSHELEIPTLGLGCLVGRDNITREHQWTDFTRKSIPIQLSNCCGHEISPLVPNLKLWAQISFKPRIRPILPDRACGNRSIMHRAELFSFTFSLRPAIPICESDFVEGIASSGVLSPVTRSYQTRKLGFNLSAIYWIVVPHLVGQTSCLVSVPFSL
jgi:hypothetical protein